MESAEAPYYILQLKKCLTLKKAKNPQYSIRSFARDIGLSPSTLSPLLKGKKGISSEMAVKVSDRLGLSQKEQSLFVLSIQSHHGRSKKSREDAQKKFKRLESITRNRRIISSENFALINHWYDFAILEVLDLSDQKNIDIQKLCEKLRLNKSILSSSLQNLESAGLIKKAGDTYLPTSSETEVTTQIPSKSIQQYHSELLDKAKSALKNDPISTREFNNVTLAFDSSKVGEARDFIKEFQEQFFEKFYSNTGHKDSVYQLSIQLFRLDRE